MTINYMAFNTETGQCTDQEVRKAVAQAINVEEMVQAIYGDYATVANSVMPTWMAPYAKDVKQTAYDPEAAKKTLADKDFLAKKSMWIFGGDGWAYDIGYGAPTTRRAAASWPT